MSLSRLLVPGLAIAAGVALFYPALSAAQPATTVQPATAQPTPPPAPRAAPRAEPTGQPGPPGERGVRPEGPANAEQSMKQMNRSFKRLERQVTDASKKEDNLKLVGEAQRGCIAAKSVVPGGQWAKEADPVKKAATLESYRRHLIVVAHKLLDLETAIMDGKGDDAAKLVAEVQKLRDASHKEMGVKDD